MITRSGLPDGRHDVGELDVAGLRHGARIERGDLGHVHVGGADEACGVRGLGDQHVVAVDAVGLQPFAVVAEVVAGRTDQCHVAAQHADGEGDVSRHAAAMNHQVVDQETERHLLQMIGQQVLGKPAGKPHQVVGRNRTCHRDRHEILHPSLVRLSSLLTAFRPSLLCTVSVRSCASLPRELTQVAGITLLGRQPARSPVYHRRRTTMAGPHPPNHAVGAGTRTRGHEPPHESQPLEFPQEPNTGDPAFAAPQAATCGRLSRAAAAPVPTRSDDPSGG